MISDMVNSRAREFLLAFTDGACSGNPGPGGWAAVLLWPEGEVREFAGAEARTTNNRMELRAAISALRQARAGSPPVRLYTDSTYVIFGLSRWIAGWRRRGWRTVEGKEVLNRDLWEQLDSLARALEGRGLSWHYVRGHAGSPGNERCDEIAVAFARGKAEQLYSGPLSRYPHHLLDLPEDVPLPTGAGARRKREGGYYLSLLEGKLERHATWPDCQARVHGKSGARFKKVHDSGEELSALKGWGASPRG